MTGLIIASPTDGSASSPPHRQETSAFRERVTAASRFGASRSIGGPSGLRRLDPFEPKLGKIERFDERVDHPNWIVFVDPVFQTLRKERRLPAIHPLDKALHPIPRKLATESYRGTHTRWGVFTQPGSEAAIDCRSGPGPLTASLRTTEGPITMDRF
jgi:hypothetical protein